MVTVSSAVQNSTYINLYVIHNVYKIVPLYAAAL